MEQDADPDSRRRTELDVALARCSAITNDTDPVEARAALATALAWLDRPEDARRRTATRHLLSMWTLDDDPAGALVLCADVLDAWRPDAEAEIERTAWEWSRDAFGIALGRLNPTDAAVAEPAIALAERVLASPLPTASPLALQALAKLHEWRAGGDPLANWTRRVALLERLHEAVRDDATASAQVGNALAAARGDEPGLDAGVAVERRLAAHAAVLATLAPNTLLHAGTAIQLATAWLDRALGDPAGNGGEAEALLVPALATARALGAADQEAQAALLLGRRHAFKAVPVGAQARSTALGFYGQGRRAAEAAGERLLVASADKFVSLVHLEALQRGDLDSFEPLRRAVEAARELFTLRPGHEDEVRKLDQIEADGCVAAGRPADAIVPLGRAIARVRDDLGRATSRAGRLELAWRLRDSAALLAWCHAACGDAQEACEALERGRGLFWRPAREGGDWSGRWTDIVPAGGAVVVPTFAGPTGFAVVATRAADGVALDVVALPDAGAEAVRALVGGDDFATRLGGWLEAWCHRTSEPGRFEAAIATIARELHHRVAAPVVACLDGRGIAEGAEVVWLPQGASSALPLQAASPDAASRRGLVDRLALRFAPSLAALERAPQGGATGRPVAIADPTGDLPFAPLEALWLAEAEPAVEILAGAAATAEALLARLARRPSLLHVAGHGAFDLDDPFASALVLAGGERLTLATLLPRLVRDGAPALAVLSACETSVARVTAWADELFGFPAALLAHGVGGVVGSLWTVADAQTALVMRVFHSRRREAGGAAALRAAQRELRDATAAELSALFEPLRLRTAPIGPIAAATVEALATFDADARPFSHPTHWAGFALWGVAPRAGAASP